MLIGALVEAVGVVAAVERESHEVAAVREELDSILVKIVMNNDGTISTHDFRLLMSDPLAAKSLQKVGVDPLGLVETADIVFKKRRCLTYGEFLELLLSLRGSNA